MRLGGGLRRMDMYRTGPKSTGTVPTLPCSLVGQIGYPRLKPWPMPEACNYRVRGAFSGDVACSIPIGDFVKTEVGSYSVLLPRVLVFARLVPNTPNITCT